MDKASKEYHRSFLLEPTKLDRLLAVMHERLQDRSDATPRDRFQLFMKGNRCDELGSLEAVLAVENTSRYRIERLLIHSAVSPTNQFEGDYEIEVDFGVEKIPKSNPTSKTPSQMVTVEIRSDSPSWNRQTLSQVEEQIERSWLNQTGPKIALVGILVLLGVFLLLQLTPHPQMSLDDPSKTMWLDKGSLDRIEQVVNDNRILTETEIREITTQQMRNVLNHHRPKTIDSQRDKNKKVLLFFGIPFLLLVAVSLYLAVTCYPGRVFLWGDEVARYRALEQRRRILWGVMVTIF